MPKYCSGSIDGSVVLKDLWLERNINPVFFQVFKHCIDYYNNVLFPSTEASPVRVESYRLKLLHLFSTLHLEHPGSSDSDTPPALMAPNVSANISPLQTSVREALQNLVGEQTKAVRTGVDTVFGWTIGKATKVRLHI